MTMLDPTVSAKPLTIEMDAARFPAFIGKADPWFRVLGLGWLTPLLRIASGDSPKAQVKDLWQLAIVPMLAIAAFLMLWAWAAPKVQTSLGAIPGPVQVWEQAGVLHPDAHAEAVKSFESQAPSSVPLANLGRIVRSPRHRECARYSNQEGTWPAPWRE